MTLSYEAGARKPEPLIYETALAKLGNIKPQEVIYLDDREPLTIAASKLGIRAMHVRDHAQTIKDIRELIGE